MKLEIRFIDEYKESIVEYAYWYGSETGNRMKILMYKYKWNIQELERLSDILLRRPWKTDPNHAFNRSHNL